eukprot:gene14554-biopygen12177
MPEPPRPVAAGAPRAALAMAHRDAEGGEDHAGEQVGEPRGEGPVLYFNLTPRPLTDSGRIRRAGSLPGGLGGLCGLGRRGGSRSTSGGFDSLCREDGVDGHGEEQHPVQQPRPGVAASRGPGHLGREACSLT